MSLAQRVKGAWAGWCFVKLAPRLALELEWERFGRPRPKTKWGFAWAKPAALFWVWLGWTHGTSFAPEAERGP